MRIGLLIYGSLEAVSGGYLYDRQLVSHLRAIGDRVEIVSLPWRGYWRGLGDNLDQALSRRLKNLPVDILLQDELTHPSVFGLNRLLNPSPYRRVAIVHHLRSSERHPRIIQWLYRVVEKLFLKQMDGFIYNSRTTRQAVKELSGLEKPGVVAYPAGDQLTLQIDEEQIHARANRTGPLRVIFVGNLIRRKGLEVLLEALSETPVSCCRLTVIGDKKMEPGYVQEIQNRIRRLGIGERVRLLGRVPASLLQEELLHSHVLAVPSTYEGFGIVYLEGMGAGLPVIATTSGAAREIITPGENGYLIRPGDAQALATHLQSLQHDRRQVEALGRAARRRYLQQPTWTQTGAVIRQFLLSIVEPT